MKVPKPTISEQAQVEFRIALEQRWNDIEAGKPNDLFERTISIRHQDRSTFKLYNASMKRIGDNLFVFTEHCGALAFPIDDLESFEYLSSFSKTRR